MKTKGYKYNKGFEPLKENICTTDYGLLPAPMEAQVAIDILSSYLLGDDWYTSLSINNEQCNAIVVEQILDRYSKKWRRDWKYFEATAWKESK